MKDKEFNQAIFNNRYNYYLKNRINNSESANKILEKIKNGYEPNKADVFELCCNNQEKIDEYREMYNLEERVKDGKISEEDYNYLINKIGINDDYLEPLLKQMFISSGKLIDNYDNKQNRSK